MLAFLCLYSPFPGYAALSVAVALLLYSLPWLLLVFLKAGTGASLRILLDSCQFRLTCRIIYDQYCGWVRNQVHASVCFWGSHTSGPSDLHCTFLHCSYATSWGLALRVRLQFALARLQGAPLLCSANSSFALRQCLWRAHRPCAPCLL